MSMSLHLYVDGVKPATDPKYHKMRAILDACQNANVSTPREVLEYFGMRWDEKNVAGYHPLPEGVRVPLIDVGEGGKVNRPKSHICADKEFKNWGNYTVTVDLEQLPDDIKLIRIELRCS